VVVHGHHDITPVASDVDIFDVVVEWQPVDRQVGLQKAPMRLRLDLLVAPFEWAKAAIYPRRHLK
jgi:hypothetical protein